MRRSRARSAASAAAAKSDGAASAARATGRRDGEASARVADANAAIVAVDTRETRGASSSSSRSSRPSPRARGPEAPFASSRDAFPRIRTGEAAAGAPRAPRRDARPFGSRPARASGDARGEARIVVPSAPRRVPRFRRKARASCTSQGWTELPDTFAERFYVASVGRSGRRTPRRAWSPRWKSAAPRARVPLEQQSLVRGRRDGNVSRGRAPRE